jgi:pentapeptide repeat protein
VRASRLAIGGPRTGRLRAGGLTDGVRASRLAAGGPRTRRLSTSGLTSGVRAGRLRAGGSRPGGLAGGVRAGRLCTGGSGIGRLRSGVLRPGGLAAGGLGGRRPARLLLVRPGRTGLRTSRLRGGRLRGGRLSRGRLLAGLRAGLLGDSWLPGLLRLVGVWTPSPSRRAGHGGLAWLRLVGPGRTLLGTTWLRLVRPRARRRWLGAGARWTGRLSTDRVAARRSGPGLGGAWMGAGLLPRRTLLRLARPRRLPGLGRELARSRRLRTALLRRPWLGRARLDRTRLRSARLSNARLSSTRLSGTRLSNARLSSTRLSGTRLSSARLSGTRLSAARLRRTRVSSIRLSRSRVSRTRLTAARLARTTRRDRGLHRRCRGLRAWRLVRSAVGASPSGGFVLVEDVRWREPARALLVRWLVQAGGVLLRLPAQPARGLFRVLGHRDPALLTVSVDHFARAAGAGTRQRHHQPPSSGTPVVAVSPARPRCPATCCSWPARPHSRSSAPAPRSRTGPCPCSSSGCRCRTAPP